MSDGDFTDIAYAMGYVIAAAGIVPTTTLATDYGGSDTLSLTDASAFPSDAFLTVWDDQREDEQAKVTEKTGNDVTLRFGIDETTGEHLTAFANDHDAGALVGTNIVIGMPTADATMLAHGKSVIFIWDRDAQTDQARSKQDLITVMMRVQVHRTLMTERNTTVDPDMFELHQRRLATYDLNRIRRALSASINLNDPLGPHITGYAQPAFREARDVWAVGGPDDPQAIAPIDVAVMTRYTR